MSERIDRIGKLQAQLSAALDARGVCETQAWREAWAALEKELMDRFMACEPEDDQGRFRVQEAMKAIRHVRAAIESKGRSSETLERELDVLEGRKMRAIA